MPQTDLRKAARHLAALRDILADARAPRPATAAAAELLLGAMSRMLADCLWQKQLMELRGFVHELHVAGNHEQWVRGPLAGRDNLRLQIFKTVNGLEARIEALRVIRQAGAAAQIASRARTRA